MFSTRLCRCGFLKRNSRVGKLFFLLAYANLLDCTNAFSADASTNALTPQKEMADLLSFLQKSEGRLLSEVK